MCTSSRPRKTRSHFFVVLGCILKSQLIAHHATLSFKRSLKPDNKYDYVMMRCRKGGCEKSMRVCHLCPFFGEPSCRLPMHEILELIVLFAHSSMDSREASNCTGRARDVAIEWWNWFRKVRAQIAKQRARTISRRKHTASISSYFVFCMICVTELVVVTSVTLWIINDGT